MKLNYYNNTPFPGRTRIYALSDSHQETRKARAFLSKILTDSSADKNVLLLNGGDLFKGIYPKELERDSYIKNNNAIKSYATNSITFQSAHNQQSLLKNVLKCITKENMIGEGRNSKVYKYTDELVIKVLKKDSTNEITLNELPEYNLGQATRKIQDNIYVLRKQEGLQHGFEDWTKVLKMLSIPQKKAQEFAKQIHKISKMPNETFDYFAKVTKYIGDNGYKNDSINPNNLLIDYERNQINIIDYIKNSAGFNEKNCYLDMVCSILDYINFEKIYRALPKEEQKIFIDDANNIIKKCYNSAKKEGLSTNKSNFEKFISDVGKIFNMDSLTDNYISFAKLVHIL